MNSHLNFIFRSLIILLVAILLGFLLSESHAPFQSELKNRRDIDYRSNCQRTDATIQLLKDNILSAAKTPEPEFTQSSLPECVASLLDKISEADDLNGKVYFRNQLWIALQSLNQSNLTGTLVAVKKLGLFAGIRDEDASVFMKAWSRFDPTNAIDFAVNSVRGDIGDRLAQFVLVGLGPETGMNLFKKLHPDSQQYVADVWMQNAARSDLVGSFQLLDRFPEGMARQSATAALAGVWSQTDPAAAAVWLSAIPQADRNIQIALSQTMERWGATNPYQAIDWAARQPDADVLFEAFLGWWKQSPAVMAGFDLLNDGDPNRDSTRSRLAVAVAGRDQNASEYLLNQIVNESVRIQTAAQIFRQFDVLP